MKAKVYFFFGVSIFLFVVAAEAYAQDDFIMPGADFLEINDSSGLEAHIAIDNVTEPLGDVDLSLLLDIPDEIEDEGSAASDLEMLRAFHYMLFEASEEERKEWASAEEISESMVRAAASKSGFDVLYGILNPSDRVALGEAIGDFVLNLDIFVASIASDYLQGGIETFAVFLSLVDPEFVDSGLTAASVDKEELLKALKKARGDLVALKFALQLGSFGQRRIRKSIEFTEKSIEKYKTRIKDYQNRISEVENNKEMYVEQLGQAVFDQQYAKLLDNFAKVQGYLNRAEMKYSYLNHALENMEYALNVELPLIITAVNEAISFLEALLAELEETPS